MTPQRIEPARNLKAILAFCFLLLGLFLLIPVFAVAYYDGFADVLGWSWIFFALALVGGVLCFLGVWSFLTPKQVGIEADFEEGGFSVEIRRFLRKDQSYRLAWRDIEEVKLIKAPRGGDMLSFRLTHEAAVHHGLIQPTTRYSASKKLVKREVALPSNLFHISIHEAFKRFESSAQQAGAKLVQAASFNVVIVSRTVWSVEWSDV